MINIFLVVFKNCNITTGMQFGLNGKRKCSSKAKTYLAKVPTFSSQARTFFW